MTDIPLKTKSTDPIQRLTLYTSTLDAGGVTQKGTSQSPEHTTGIDGNATGETDLWTAIDAAILISVIVQITAVSGFTTPPKMRILLDAKEVIPADTPIAFSVVDRTYMFFASGTGEKISVGEIIKLDIVTAGTGALLTLAADAQIMTIP